MCDALGISVNLNLPDRTQVVAQYQPVNANLDFLRDCGR